MAFVPFLVKASINAAAEGLTQLAMSALGGQSVADALNGIDWGEVASEGLKGLVPWKIPGGKFGKCAVTAAGNVATQAVMNAATYSPEQAIIDFVTSLIECLSDKCAKKKDPATEKAIAELKEKLEKFKKKLGVDDAAKNGPYSHLPDHPSVGPGKSFTQSQKKKFLAENKKANAGTLRDDVTGEELVRPQKHTKGVRPPDNEAHIDHVDARSKGRSNSSSNANVRSRKNNLEKSDD